jgi:hypothetical protein
MVGVTVGDDDLRKFVAVQCGGKRIEVATVSDAGIYERRYTSGNQPRPVAFTRHLSGIEGVHCDCFH